MDATAQLFVLPLAKGLVTHFGHAILPKSLWRSRGDNEADNSIPPSRAGTPKFAMSGAVIGCVMGVRSEMPEPTSVLLLISGTSLGRGASAEALTAAFHEYVVKVTHEVAAIATHS